MNLLMVGFCYYTLGMVVLAALYQTATEVFGMALPGSPRRKAKARLLVGYQGQSYELPPSPQGQAPGGGGTETGAV